MLRLVEPMQPFIDRSSIFFRVFIREQYYMTLLKGVQETLLITLIATLIGLFIGACVALIQVSQLPDASPFKKVEHLSKKLAKVYIDIIRGTPAVAQVSVIWLIVLKSPMIPTYLAGGIAFGINSGAYMAELIRAGIQGIEKGQIEAARSLGLSYKQAMQYIVLPQAFKQMLPALVNEFIVLIKETAVIGFIGGRDIMRAANIMIAQTGNLEMPLLLACVTYLLLTGVFTKMMRLVEKKVMQST